MGRFGRLCRPLNPGDRDAYVLASVFLAVGCVA